MVAISIPSLVCSGPHTHSSGHSGAGAGTEGPPNSSGGPRSKPPAGPTAPVSSITNLNLPPAVTGRCCAMRWAGWWLLLAAATAAVLVLPATAATKPKSKLSGGPGVKARKEDVPYIKCQARMLRIALGRIHQELPGAMPGQVPWRRLAWVAAVPSLCNTHHPQTTILARSDAADDWHRRSCT